MANRRQPNRAKVNEVVDVVQSRILLLAERLHPVLLCESKGTVLIMALGMVLQALDGAPPLLRELVVEAVEEDSLAPVIGECVAALVNAPVGSVDLLRVRQ